MNARPAIAVCAQPPHDPAAQCYANELAAELNLPLIDAAAPGDVELLLTAHAHRLELHVVGGEAELRGGRPILVNLLQVDTRSPAGRRGRQPIARAVGLVARKEAGRSPPRVLDATAGYGEDAWLLASLGCSVIAVERSPIVAALLRDGLRRAAQVAPSIAARIELRLGDSKTLAPLMDEVDVVYLDPMFPGGRKTVERKPMRVLRKLVGADEDADDLLRAALARKVHRVVVKRPLRAAVVAGVTPTVTHKGRAMRYDVYVQP